MHSVWQFGTSRLDVLVGYVLYITRRKMELNYKTVVQEIRELNWRALNPSHLQILMYLSWIAAVEFAESLRIALVMNPNNKNLRETAAGELKTRNLTYGSFTEPGDHATFLEHFIRENGIEVPAREQEASSKYLKDCRFLPNEVRAMSVFSREEELERIFKEILKAKDWSAPGLAEYRFFLERHILLDTEEGGHHDLTKEFPVDDRVLPFYMSRLELYRAIPTLFETQE